MITKDCEPICLAEYCTRIANQPFTFVIQVQTEWYKEQTFKTKHEDVKKDFNELVLS